MQFAIGGGQSAPAAMGGEAESQTRATTNTTWEQSKHSVKGQSIILSYDASGGGTLPSIAVHLDQVHGQGTQEERSILYKGV